MWGRLRRRSILAVANHEFVRAITDSRTPATKSRPTCCLNSVRCIISQPPPFEDREHGYYFKFRIVMPRRRRKHNGRRKHRPSFPFFNLPPDLQLHILSYSDIQTLQNAISATPYIRDLYELYPETFLHTATRHHGQQIQNLMLTTLSIARSIHSINMYQRPALENMHKYFADSLDTDQPRRILQPCDDAIPVLDMLCDMDAEVDALVYSYAHDTHARACRSDNPGAVVPPLHLSETEYHRISRAFWRLKLYGVLFYNYADRIGLLSARNYQSFLSRLATFEMDEMVTAYQFMVRYRLYFTSAFPHIGCPFEGQNMSRNRDPFECPDCQGRWSKYGSAHIQAFWCTVEHAYLGEGMLWTDPRSCRKDPIRSWDDRPEADVPNAGYVKFSALRELWLEKDEFVCKYRNLGWCFWEKERLEGWDFWDQYEYEYESDGSEW